MSESDITQTSPQSIIDPLHRPGVDLVSFEYRGADGNITIKTVQPVDWYYGTTPCCLAPDLILRGVCVERREILRYPLFRIVRWIPK
jgi:hypothetical protein